ncbi:glycosyltransferase [bacterium]|nr:glycosyltransferase [candidate division CSSED10-310 bacterium]
MKIGFIAYESSERASARVRAYRFAEVLARFGHDTHVLSFADRFGHPGETAYRLPDTIKIRDNIRALRLLQKEQDDLLYIQKVGYHVVAPLLRRWIRGVPVIIDYDDWDLEVQPFRSLRLFGMGDIEAFTARVFKRARAVVTASRILEQLARRLVGETTGVFCIPTGVDTGRFTPAVHDQVERDVTFCWTGLIWNEDMFDNVNCIIEAFAAMTVQAPCTLIIAGRYYAFEQRLRGLAASMPPDRRIELPGWIAPETVPDLLRSCDIGLFILTRDTPYHQAKSPTKLFEYMASGLPTVVGFHGESLAVIEDGRSGIIVHDRTALARAMEILASRPDLRVTLGTNARSVAETRYGLAVLADRLNEVVTGCRPAGEGIA